MNTNQRKTSEKEDQQRFTKQKGRPAIVYQTDRKANQSIPNRKEDQPAELGM
jgi:predicted ArsR family transcriptional regulator